MNGFMHTCSQKSGTEESLSVPVQVWFKQEKKPNLITSPYCCIKCVKTEAMEWQQSSFSPCKHWHIKFAIWRGVWVVNNLFPCYDHRSFADLLGPDLLHILFFSCSCHLLSPHYTLSERFVLVFCNEGNEVNEREKESEGERQRVISWSQLYTCAMEATI